MAYLFRLILSFSFFLVIPSSQAGEVHTYKDQGSANSAFCSWYSAYYACWSSEVVQPGSSCSDGAGKTWTNSGSLPAVVGCKPDDNVWPGSNGRIVYYSNGSCPTGTTLNGSTGECVSSCSPPKFINSSGQCVEPCQSGDVAYSDSSLIFDSMASRPAFLCKGSCQVTFGSSVCASGVGTGCRLGGPFLKNGNSCTGADVDGSGGVSPNDTDDAAKAKDVCLKNGKGYIVSNGVVTCIAADVTQTETSSATTGGSTSSSTTETKTSGDRVTETTTTTDASGTTTSSSTDSSIEAYCLNHPAAALCSSVNKGYTFGDVDCNMKFVCDGDAASCAQALIAKTDYCAKSRKDGVVGDLGLDSSGLANAKTAGDSALNSDGSKDFNLYTSFEEKRQNYVTYASSCIPSASFTYRGTTYTIDTSAVCNIGLAIKVFLHIAAYLGVVKMLSKTVPV